MGFTAKDIIDQNNVVDTYTEGRYVCFVLKNGLTVKLNPNQVSVKGGETDKQGKK